MRVNAHMQTVFWLSIFGVLYAYFFYPLVLNGLKRVAARVPKTAAQPPNYSVSIIIPVHNEERVLPTKLENLAALHYPPAKLQVIFVSDGSTDRSVELLREAKVPYELTLVEVEQRKGKANALNAGLAESQADIVVFSDASIMLEPDAIDQILRLFADPEVGCVSGEDHIAGQASEGLYGRYELFLRNQESALGSIVGASGSFYAQRRVLCQPFQEGLAPDFLSVLNTVEQGYRAMTEPAARGYMTAVTNTKQEFQRKVRTLLRGITTLLAKPKLLNPFRYGLFSVFLISHKLMRWIVPFLLVSALLANIALAHQPFYFGLLILQAAFYVVAAFAYFDLAKLQSTSIGRVILFFVMVNIAIFAAWIRYWKGERQELWTPSERTVQ